MVILAGGARLLKRIWERDEKAVSAIAMKGIGEEERKRYTTARHYCAGNNGSSACRVADL